jgi:hypothetical protein
LGRLAKHAWFGLSAVAIDQILSDRFGGMMRAVAELGYVGPFFGQQPGQCVMDLVNVGFDAPATANHRLVSDDYHREAVVV